MKVDSAAPQQARVRPAAGGLSDDPLWYKDAVIYEVRARSFYDSNGDGVGDLQGLAQKLDYLADLGITALWILPHYPSPGRDDGYDIADYTDVHPDLGSLDDFDHLIAEAHRRGIRVITELVLNHTSDQHPWFQRARRAPKGSSERDFYVWSETTDRYTDARIIFRDFEPSNWSWDGVAKAYFWHRFFAHQPDLNFENPAVHDALFEVVDFWLARGVDGLRLDAVPYLYEEEGTNCENLPRTHAFLKKLRAHVDEKFKGRMLLAEANQWPDDAARYFGTGDECHMNFHFPIMPRLFMSIHMEDRFPIIDILRQTPELPESCQWAMFLRNHDELTLEMVTDEERDYMYRVYAHEARMRINLGIRRRLAPLTGNDRRRMELLNGLLFSMPGTPVLYYGDEIGMGDNVYLGDRNGVRTPMQWSADRNAGFSRANPQKLILPIIIDPEYHYEALNVEAQQSSSSSLLWWTKRLIALRKRYQAFGRGTVEFLHPSNPRVLAFIRRFEGETVLVVANLSRHVQYVELELPSMRGMIPVEMMGGTRFPTVGEGPYVVTLGGHDFYWFSVEVPRTATRDARISDLGPVPLSCGSLAALLSGNERPTLEEALPAYLGARSLAEAAASAQIVEMAELPQRADSAIHLAFVNAEYTEGEPVRFMLPLVARPRSAPLEGAAGTPVAQLEVLDAPMGERSFLLAESAPEALGRAMVDAIRAGASLAASSGKVACGLLPGVAASALPDVEPRVLAADHMGATIGFGTSHVLRVYARMEEGTAPALEVGRVLQGTTRTPKVLGYVEYCSAGSEPLTLAVLEEFVANEGSGWHHARSELGRAFEHVLAQPTAQASPTLPTGTLLELTTQEPEAGHAALLGTYRDSAHLLGQRVAELHAAFASCTDAAFEPHAYTTMDQRSKYQSARNLIGRVLASLRRSLVDLSPDAQDLGAHVLAAEDLILAQFEPLLTHRIDSRQIRLHGDLHLGRVLFTGKDFVITSIGGGRERRLSSRRRKAGALRDVASMIRSFDYAAATTLRSVRPEDQERAAPWSWVWQRWAAAAFLRGYLEAAQSSVFLARDPYMLSVLVETAVLEKAFAELRNELKVRPEMVMVPLSAIARMVDHLRLARS